MESNTIEERQHFIGGSDIAGILGLSRWATPLSVWADKTGQTPPRADKPLYLTLGTRLEEVVAELFMEETGKRLIRANERRVHPKYPMFAAQIDRLVVNEDAVWEGKTASAWKKKEWVEEEIPAEYICQVMWQLAVSGRKYAYISCLIGNEKFVTKKIDRDPVMIAEMLKRAESFWNDFVIPKVMPMQITSHDADTLYSLFPTAEKDSQIDLGDDGAILVESREALLQDKSVVVDQLEKIDNQLKALMKDKETGDAGRYKISWKNQSRKGYTVVYEPKVTRVFNVRPKKDVP